MISGKRVSVRKSRSGGDDTFIITLTDSIGTNVWTSDPLLKSGAVDHLLEIGVPSFRIPQKFEEAERAAMAEQVEA